MMVKRLRTVGAVFVLEIRRLTAVLCGYGEFTKLVDRLERLNVEAMVTMALFTQRFTRLGTGIIDHDGSIVLHNQTGDQA